MKTGIFRDELPGEKKSIVNLLMTGYIVVISCLGYAAFYIFIQMVQVDPHVNRDRGGPGDSYTKAAGRLNFGSQLG